MSNLTTVEDKPINFFTYRGSVRKMRIYNGKKMFVNYPAFKTKTGFHLSFQNY
ncbi:hypothetical protein [Bacillus cereus]|uniref:hypothetical protein n=1 Tax=Bacillus cereus TaxID=1396 RepID=UPI001482267B|nr:hypothetical protein [Bacillus cereus]